LASSPLATVAGAHPLSDLLFSPRAAFIWNHTRKSVVWMNPAARAAFALRLEDFSASLPAGLIRRFAQFADRKEGGFAKVNIPGAPILGCSIEILKLADGQDGLIVAEVEDEEERRLLPAPAYAKASKSEPKKTIKKAPAGSAKGRSKTPQTPPALTAEEMRAFKAVGRKVLRLCAEKECPNEPTAARGALPAPASSESAAGSPDRLAQTLTDVLAAFDVVLFLGEGLDIVGVRGRAAQLGWRKSNLTGKTVGALLAPYDRALLRRMLKKLRSQTVYGSRDTLVVSGENGEALPCRAVAGRWEHENAAFFLAFISLEPPARLKRSQPANGMAPSRIAA
jgi:hypothetical protein